MRTEDRVGIEWLVPARTEVNTKVKGTFIMRASMYRFKVPYL